MIAYCTNCWNHYQQAFGEAMYKLIGSDFKLVLFQPLDTFGDQEVRLKMGWNLNPAESPWLVPAPTTESQLKDGIWNRLLADADIAVVGYCRWMSEAALRLRRQQHKITFFMGERLFKSRISWRDYLSPHFVKSCLDRHFMLAGSNTHYLTIGHFGGRDLCFLRVCKGRIFTWSYFPSTTDFAPKKLAHNKLRIGWCGRMVGWKHVEYIVQAIGLLSESERSQCEVIIVGDGNVRSGLECLAERKGLMGCIRFEPFKTVPETMEFMRSLDVYVFPSDRGEGWGVALMEAMDKGCVPIANTDAGATLDLVKDGVNGYLFEDGDVQTLAKSIRKLLADRNLLDVMGECAWRTVQQWSPQKGAEVLLRIIDYVKTGCLERSTLPTRGLGSIKG